MTGRRPLFRSSLFATLVASALLAAACGDSSLGGEEDNGGDTGPVKLGLLVPQSGVYKSLGDDMKRGFELYVEQHGGKALCTQSWNATGV